MLFEHLLVGQTKDGIARRLGGRQRARHVFTILESEALGQDVGVPSILGDHVQLLEVIDDLRRQADLVERIAIELAGANRLGIDHLFTRARRRGLARIIEVARILVRSAQAVLEHVLEIVQVPLAMFIERQVTVLREVLGHAVDR